MKIIEGLYHINNTESTIFYKYLKESINKLQEVGQQVEVQYKVNDLGNGQLCYSALVIGRSDFI